MNPNLLQLITDNQVIKQLQPLLKACNKPKETLRVVAVLLAQVMEVKAVAQLLAMGESTLYKYLGRFKCFPQHFFQESHRSGAPSRSHKFLAKLLGCMKVKPRDVGYYSTRWNCGLLAHHLKDALCQESIRQLLQKSGYRWKRPKHGPAVSPDPLAEAKLARIQEVKDSLTERESLVYADEADFNLLCPLRSSWSLKGVQEVVTTPGRNRKIYAFGAYEPDSGQLIYKVTARKRTQEFVEFLYQVLMNWPGKVYLVVDNSSIHFSHRVKAFCERHKDRLELLPLPSYSPQYNKIERLWGMAKDLTHCNYTCHDVHELKRAARTGLRMVQRKLQGWEVA